MNPSDPIEQFQAKLDQVFAMLEQEPWFEHASNYLIEINITDRPQTGQYLTLATTSRGGHVPTKITYYINNIHDQSISELYRITKHEFAHLWGLDEKDAQAVET